jgi:hypothetical protein
MRTAVAAANALISCPDHVQAWDISLEELSALGSAAADAVRWSCHGGLTPAQDAVFAQVWEFADRLAQEWKDWRPPYAEMKRFLAGSAGSRTGFEITALQWSPWSWQVEFWVSGDGGLLADRGHLQWRLRLGRLAAPFLEYLLSANIEGRPLTVRVQPSHDRGHPMSYPWFLEVARRRAEQRRELQAMDAAELDPIVLIDNDWEPRFLAGSVMTQLIDWHFRIRDNADANRINCPSPDGAALEWWLEWVRKASRNRDVGLPEALTVAKRSVRPATPAAHHKYWRQSLRSRSRAQIEQACGLLGISRSAAYARLQRRGRRARDFESVTQLTEFLRNQSPPRRIATVDHELIDALIANGMKPETARKHEYRLRSLPQAERTKRLLKTLEKLTARNASTSR